MNINLRHLYAFREAARLQSISAAARCVHLSQPAVTQAIANVERYFNTRLLNRSSSGVALTQAGQICLDRAERALGEIRDGIAEVAGGSAVRPTADLGRLIRVAQLDALTTVVQHRNFSAAARARGVAQPTMHRATRELERILGIPLFEKTSFGVVPTRDAERLARRVKLAFAEIAQARAELAALEGSETGSTVIGAMPLARTYILPSVLILFAAQRARHHVILVDGTYEHLLGALKAGEVDFLIGAMRDPHLLSDVVQEHLFDDPLSIVVRAGHPLAGSKRVPSAALVEYPWITPRAGSPLRAHYHNLFAWTGLEPPHTSIECNSIAASRALLLESDRMMLLSVHQVYHELRAGLLAALPHPAGGVVRPIGLTFRKGWRPTNSQEHLLRLLRERAHTAR